MANTDRGLNQKEFYEPGINQKIAIRDLGGIGAFYDFMEHLSQVGESKRVEGAGGEITEFKSLMRGYRIGRNSPGNLKISGPLAGSIVETLIYGEERKSAADLRIGRIKPALSDFANQLKSEKHWKEKKYREKNWKEIIEKKEN